MTTSLTLTEALDIIFSYKSGLNRRGEMGRDDIFFERDAREGLRAARELSRCDIPKSRPLVRSRNGSISASRRDYLVFCITSKRIELQT